ncbi:Aspartokinase 1, chloroplastic [Zea mays]|uniref:Aspartokinase 1, chloroplastic n=1 Tax=Zea mays TaxID=4577 RepID=A0A3L6G859_MAIZE|nr:Aspartokinase 1, chloroplastic [Zea mays]
MCGSDKSDREGSYASALWLHAWHPHTLALNAAPLANFGYLKDLPELLHQIVHGGMSTRTPGKKARLTTKCRRGQGQGHVFFGNRTRRSRAERATCVGSTEERVTASLERDRGLSDDPWRDRVVTFSWRPELHRIADKTLSEKTRFIQSMVWGTNTDFQAQKISRSQLLWILCKLIRFQQSWCSLIKAMMICHATFSCPPWFSSGARKIIKHILDPNPDSIKIAEILEDEWFKKGYKPPHFEQGEDVNLDDVDAAFNDSEGWKSGVVTTLGQGGSDLTATTIGKALGLREIQVLHPQSMRPAREGDIPVRVKNSYNPKAPGTLITRQRDMYKVVLTSIVLKSNVTMLDIVSTRMLGQYGFLARVFAIFEDLCISVDCVATSEVSVSMSLDPSKIWSRELIQQTSVSIPSLY